MVADVTILGYGTSDDPTRVGHILRCLRRVATKTRTGATCLARHVARDMKPEHDAILSGRGLTARGQRIAERDVVHVRNRSGHFSDSLFSPLSQRTRRYRPALMTNWTTRLQAVRMIAQRGGVRRRLFGGSPRRPDISPWLESTIGDPSAKRGHERFQPSVVTGLRRASSDAQVDKLLLSVIGIRIHGQPFAFATASR